MRKDIMMKNHAVPAVLILCVAVILLALFGQFLLLLLLVG